MTPDTFAALAAVIAVSCALSSSTGMARMADRPILFSGPMVRALLDGRKTQTRRVLTRARVFATPEQPAFTLAGDDLARALQNASSFRLLDGDGWSWEADAFSWQAPSARTGWMAHISYAPGDRLYVREAWHAARSLDSTPPREIPHDCDIEHAATARNYAEIGLKGKLRPAMYLPRWASRLTLMVTDVSVVRLQDISKADAIAEGIRLSPHGKGDQWMDYPEGSSTAGWNDPRESFRSLWNSLNDARGHGWNENPFVVAITFEVIKQNIDQIELPEVPAL